MRSIAFEQRHLDAIDSCDRNKLSLVRMPGERIGRRKMRGRRSAGRKPLERGRDALPYAFRARGLLRNPGLSGGF